MPPRRPDRQNRVKTAVPRLVGDALALVGDRDRRLRWPGRRPVRPSMVTVPAPWRSAFSSRLPSDLVELVGVDPHLRDARRRRRPTNRDGSSPRRLHRGDVPRRRRGQVDDLPAHAEPAGVDPGDVEQLGDQPGDPVGVGVDGLQHQPLLLVGEPVPLGEQRRGEALDAGQRRAELVRDGGDQLGAAELLAGPGPGARGARRRRRVTGPRGCVADVAGGDQHLAARRAGSGCARGGRWR